MPPRGKPGSRRATRKKQQERAAAKKSTTAFTPENIKAAAEERKQQEAKNKRAAARRAATRAANKSKAANKAAMKAAAAPKSLGARVLGKALPAAGLAVTAAEIVREASKIPAKRKADKARQTAVAKNAEQQAVKPRPGQSPTDAMRNTSKGREVLEPAKRAASKYKVKSGDTLSQIAKKNGTTVRAIMKASGIKNANQIKVGQQITIPDDVKRKGPYGKITKKELESGKYNTSKTPKFGADFSYGGSMKKKTTMKNKGGKIGSNKKDKKGGAPHNRLY